MTSLHKLNMAWGAPLGSCHPIYSTYAYKC
jgi:hypothetical protein